MISRQMQSLLKRLVAQFPAVLVTGARQVGKSTLLQHIGEGYQYITFDDPMLLELAKQESRLFLNHQGKLILDEVQYVPEIFALLKLEIDKNSKTVCFYFRGRKPLN